MRMVAHVLLCHVTLKIMTEFVQVSAECGGGEAGGAHHPGVCPGAGSGSPAGRISCQAQLHTLCGGAFHWPGRHSEASCSDA